MEKIILTLFCLSLCGCFQTENSSAQDAGAYSVASPEFAAAKQVFLNHCTICHGYEGMTVAEFIAQGLLIPGDPENSRIYYRIRGSSGANGAKNMPDDGSTTPLSPDDLAAISTWVTNATP